MKFQSIKKQISKDWVGLHLPGVPHTAAALQYFLPVLAKRYGLQIRWLCFLQQDHGRRGRWLLPIKDYERMGRKVFYNKRFFNRIYEQNEQERKKFFDSVRRLERKGIAQTKNKLLGQYRNFLDMYLAAYSPLMVPAFITYTLVDPEIQRLSKKYGVSLQTHCTPVRPVSVQLYESALRRIVRRYPDRRSRAFKDAIKVHRRRFYWIYSNYYGTLFPSISQVTREAFGLQGSKAIRLSSLPKLSRNDSEIFYRLRQVAYWQDIRKRVNQTANAWLLRFLQQAEKVTGVPYEELRFTTPDEFIGLLSGHRVTGLKERQPASGVYSSLAVRERILTASQTRELWRSTEQRSRQDSVSGIAVQSGKVSGRVKIVFNAATDGKKLKKNDILVTGMTRPEFYTLMHRAAAIVTDEGGVTSHAAVISRELRKPCIVATTLGTSTFKDGDMVEVDADKGIVRKI